jgi:hypothetical protein
MQAPNGPLGRSAQANALNGLRGAVAYANRYASAAADHVIALESDLGLRSRGSGTFRQHGGSIGDRPDWLSLAPLRLYGLSPQQFFSADGGPHDEDPRGLNATSAHLSAQRRRPCPSDVYKPNTRSALV